MKNLIFGFVLLIPALLLSFAQAQTPIVNGSFETGDYTGWVLIESPDTDDPDSADYGTWGIAEDSLTVSLGDFTHDFFDDKDVQQFSHGLPHTYVATEGGYVAYQLQNDPQLHQMYQDINVCKKANDLPLTLSWDMEYSAFEEFVPDLQYSAVEIRDENTDDILATLFETVDGDATSIPMTAMSADISGYAGEAVRLMITHQVQLGSFPAAWDNFRVLGCETDEPGEPDELDTVGFESPANKSSIAIKKNRTLPLKAFIYKEGELVTDADLVSPPIVLVMPAPDNLTYSGIGTDDDQFVFTDEEMWQFNLKIKNYQPGTYLVTMQSGDEAEYLLNPVPTATIVVKGSRNK